MKSEVLGVIYKQLLHYGMALRHAPWSIFTFSDALSTSPHIRSSTFTDITNFRTPERTKKYIINADSTVVQHVTINLQYECCYTVEPQYYGHPWDWAKVTLMERCQYYRG